MVILPPQFVSTKYPGYFWNLEEQKLYSLKVNGILTPLRFYFSNKFSEFIGYRVSVNGVKKAVHISYLKSLNRAHDSMVPMSQG